MYIKKFILSTIYCFYRDSGDISVCSAQDLVKAGYPERVWLKVGIRAPYQNALIKKGLLLKFLNNRP
jgi:hypothetical protein